MASPAASESLSTAPENASVLIDNSPRKSLDRREFLKLASGLTASIPISNLGRTPGLDTREGVGFWNAIYAIDQLNIDPSSVHLIKRGNSPNWNPRLSVEMTSKDPGNFNPRFTKENPKANAAKIELTFTGKDRQNHLDNIHTASHLAAFVIDAAVLSRAVRAFEAGGMAAALSVYSDADQKFWTKERKLILVGGSLTLAGLACVYTAQENSQTQQTPEGIEATQALTSIPTQGDGVPLPTDNGGGVTLEVTPLPIIPVDFPGKDLNIRYLQENGAKIQNPNPEFQPSPTSVPFSGNEQQIDPVEYTKSLFNLSDFNIQDPLIVLKYLAAQGPREGTNGGITWYQTGPNNEENPAFAGLTIYREQTQHIEGEYTISEGFPKGLVLRNGSGISVLGRGSDGNIIVTFEEYQERNGQPSPRLRFAILTPNEFGNISSSFLNNCKFYLDNPDRITYTNEIDKVQRTVMLNHIDKDLITEIRKEAGAIWKDKDAEGNLSIQPVVPFPENGLLKGLNSIELNYINVSDVDVYGNSGFHLEADSTDGQVRLYGAFNRLENNWKWIPRSPDFSELQPSFDWALDFDNNPNYPYLPLDNVTRDNSVVEIIDNPLGVSPPGMNLNKVLHAEIFKAKDVPEDSPDYNHRAYIPWGDPNFTWGENDTVISREPPFIMGCWLYINKIDPRIGVELAPNGQNVWALAGDFTGATELNKFLPFANNILSQPKPGIYYLLPMSFYEPYKVDFGEIVDTRASLLLNAWNLVEFIVTKEGCWTSINGRIAGFVVNKSPALKAFVPNFGPYASGEVELIDTEQASHFIRFYSPTD